MGQVEMKMNSVLGEESRWSVVFDEYLPHSFLSVDQPTFYS